MGGARLLGLRDRKRLTDHLGHDLGTRDASVPLNDRAQDADEVYVLVGFLVHALDVGLTREGDQRGAIQEGVGHGSDQVRRPWAEGSEAYARAARQSAVGVRHISPALLVADG